MHIAHQDLKPSNVLMFDGTEDDLLETKIADLGRASRDGVSAVHDVSNVAGAYAYSPPELLYGQVAIDFYERRQSCDLYQMGCLIAFVLAATSVNDEWNSLLSPGQVWRVWGGTYADIYPTIRRAMDDVFDLVESRLDGSIRDEVGRLVRDLCDPDPRTRGSRLRAASRNPRLVLTRLVTRLDVLEKRAEIKNLMVA
jgi:serine/threonine protein kinase